jgi:hypothetical protein
MQYQAIHGVVISTYVFSIELKKMKCSYAMFFPRIDKIRNALVIPIDDGPSQFTRQTNDVSRNIQLAVSNVVYLILFYF